MVPHNTQTITIFGLPGTAVSLGAFIPYGIGIYKRTVRPHLFIWIIWSIVTIVAAAGQFVAGAGPSAWCTAAIALTCLITLVASIFRGDPGRTRSDWIFLIAALAAIPAWIITKDPTISVCIVTAIELAGFGPTVRKTFADPYSESLSYFALCVLKYALAVAAVQTWTIAAAIYPAVTVAAAAGMCALIIIQRRRAH